MSAARRTAICFAVLSSAAHAQETIQYTRDVFPILETYCIGCHTSDDPQGGLVMENFADLMKGGESGLAVTSGVPGSSRLLLMASGKLAPVMPPDDAEGPNEAELEILSQWIEQGAPGPEGKLPIKRKLRTPQISSNASVDKPITAIAESSTGNWMARGRFGEILITSAAGPAVATINDIDLGKVNSLAFSGDGSKLLVASGLTGAYGRAAVYATETGELITELLGHRDILYAAEFSPDETMIATAGYDRTIVLWETNSGKPIRELTGHNGAIFDLAFSPDGNVLVSACADETAKVWNVQSGQRLDTLSQTEGEVFAVSVTADNQHIVAGSADNRLRVWRLVSKDVPRINPIVATRFVDETPVIDFDISPDGKKLVAIAESGNVKVIETTSWQTTLALQPLNESGTDLVISPDSQSVTISLMNGQIVTRDIANAQDAGSSDSVSGINRLYMDLGTPMETDEESLKSRVGESTRFDATVLDTVLDIERNVTIKGVLDSPGQADVYRWKANRGEVWAIDADKVKSGRLDPIVTILDANGEPVIRTRLQAVRDSYFTFRGKNSDQFNDFRVFAWQEMKLNEYLYAAGEVTRLAVHPRGPDSGFNVYPGEGKRWTYFGTSPRTHALGEPAYIVRELPSGAAPIENGLPVFKIPYTNDDDPSRVAGESSRIVFTAPHDGLFSVQISDTRGEGGSEYGYSLSIRAAKPDFTPSATAIAKPLLPGIGREFDVRIDRLDEFDGPVRFEIDQLPGNTVSNFPVTIAEGQRSATAVVWASPDESGWEGEFEARLVASGLINGKRVERKIVKPIKLKFEDVKPKVIPSISPSGASSSQHAGWTLQVQRGKTVTARVAVTRAEGFKGEVSFGKETSGRNATQGVYVDNIGLNGLLIVAGASEREFSVTADETAVPGTRSFFLTAATDGGLSTHPIMIEVLP